MDYSHLGRSGLSVSRLCLGTMNFGPETSEQIIGRWFAQGDGRREKTVIATKVYGEMGDWPNEKYLSARNIRHACDASLRRLQTDHVDLYQMHHVDRSTPWDEIWEAFEVLRSQGKVLYFGSSNHAGWHIAQAMEAARRRGRLGLVSEQSLYNLMERTVELEVLPACEDYGVGVIPWSPLHGGLLGGIIRKTEQGKRRLTGRAKEGLRKNRSAIKKWEALCDELGENPADVALAWLLHQPAVTAPIIGPRTLEQLEGSVRATEIELTDDVLAQLDEIFPGPGGTAPEAYAW
jgi:aryl-alcohol dehydrogenase-like predicted oxidoreductase